MSTDEDKDLKPKKMRKSKSKEWADRDRRIGDAHGIFDMLMEKPGTPKDPTTNKNLSPQLRLLIQERRDKRLRDEAAEAENPTEREDDPTMGLEYYEPYDDGEPIIYGRKKKKQLSSTNRNKKTIKCNKKIIKCSKKLVKKGIRK